MKSKPHSLQSLWAGVDGLRQYSLQWFVVREYFHLLLAEDVLLEASCVKHNGEAFLLNLSIVSLRFSKCSGRIRDGVSTLFYYSPKTNLRTIAFQ